MSISENNSLIGVDVMIIDESDKILLGSRIKIGEKPTWCFPGGKIEPHETFEQSAVREVVEETNLLLQESKIIPFTLLINKASSQINPTVGVFIKLEDSSTKKDIIVTEPEIFNKWSWFSINELPNNLFPASEAMINIWKKNKLSEEWSSYPIKLENYYD